VGGFDAHQLYMDHHFEKRKGFEKKAHLAKALYPPAATQRFCVNAEEQGRAATGDRPRLPSAKNWRKR